MKNRILLIIAFLFSINLIQASINVKGKIVASEDDSPIVGAEIKIRVDSVKEISAKTNNTGNFSITIPDKSRTCDILINQLGYNTQKISIANMSENVDLGKIQLSPKTKTLNEVEIVASKVIDLPDKSIVFPSQLEKDRAINPLNLLSQISYSTMSLSVDEHSKSLKIEGLTPQILINGVKRDYADFNALNPQEILKIEYITYKDMRYGAPYINIITVRPPTGGTFMAELSAPVTTRQENHQIYTAYRRDKHELSLNYNGSFRDSRKEYKESFEKYIYPDKIEEYSFTSLPSRNLDRYHEASAEYTLSGGPQKVLVTTATLRYHSQDSKNQQQCDLGHDSFRRDIDWRSKLINPSLNVYGSLPVTDNGRLEIGLSGVYQHGDYTRALSQTNGYSEATFTNSNSYSVGADIYYSHRFSWSRLTAGITHTYTHASNDYIIEGEQSLQKIHKNRTSAFAGLRGRLGEVGSYYAAVGLVYTCRQRKHYSVCISDVSKESEKIQFPLRLRHELLLTGTE